MAEPSYEELKARLAEGKTESGTPFWGAGIQSRGKGRCERIRAW